jgi:regulator of replication initiation timing
MTTIGVPTQSSVTTYQHNKTTLELLLNLQQLVDDFKVKLVEMEEEMDAIKIENNVLRNKIRELTSPSSIAKSTLPQRRGGCFGYGADEF